MGRAAISGDGELIKILRQEQPGTELIKAAAAPSSAAAPGETRGRGRPEGAKSRRSPELVRRIADKYGVLPGEVLADAVLGGYQKFIDGPPDEVPEGGFVAHKIGLIAKATGLKTRDAANFYVGLLKTLMPFIHPRVGPSTKDQRTAINLNVIVPPQSDGQNPGRAPGGGFTEHEQMFSLTPEDICSKK